MHGVHVYNAATICVMRLNTKNNSMENGGCLELLTNLCLSWCSTDDAYFWYEYIKRDFLFFYVSFSIFCFFQHFPVIFVSFRLLLAFALKR